MAARVAASGVSATRKLFVGKLKWNVCADTISQYFSKFGNVRHSRIAYDMETGISKGFGFVEMETIAAAQKICSQLEPHYIGRYRIVVRPQNKTKVKPNVTSSSSPLGNQGQPPAK